MKYIAINNSEFILINNTHNEQDLIDKGFTLYTLEEYNNYILQSNQMSDSEFLEMLESKAVNYITFGVDLWDKIKRKVWAYNTLGISKGNLLTVDQMKTLLSISDLLEKSLKTGSLLTAIDVCNGLKVNLPQYAPISNFAIAEISAFLGI